MGDGRLIDILGLVRSLREEWRPFLSIGIIFIFTEKTA